jgi:hypothetical protein
MLDEITRRLAAGPAHFPHTLDAIRDRILLIGLSESDIANASFLDQRILTPAIKGDWASFTDIAERLDPAARDDAQYIFHIGHVGSTLISRLLGSWPEILALREPLLLRSLADLWARREAVDMPWDPAGLPARTATIRRLLARTFRPDQRAIIKATSFTSEIAPHMLAPDARALFLYVSPQTYMRTILAGDGSRQELVTLTGPRLTRLNRRLEPMPFRMWSLEEGTRVALAWVTEMLSLSAAEAAMPAGSVLWLDFEDFLATPEASLLQVAQHFGLSPADGEVARLIAGPLMHSYSKAPEHRYDTDLRRRLLSQAASDHPEALRAGAMWLDRLAAEHGDVARLRGLGG